MDLTQVFSENLVSGHFFRRRDSRQRTTDLYDPSEKKSFWQFWLSPLLNFLLWSVVLIFLSNVILLQVIQGNYLKSVSVFNSLQKVPTPAERGLILSAEGKILAGNAPSFDLYFYGNLCLTGRCDLDFLRSFSFYSKEKAAVLARSTETTIIHDLTQADALAVEDLIKDKPFLELKTGQKRSYPLADAFFHLLGYVSPVSAEDLQINPSLDLSQKVGRLGVERVYDAFLTGQPGGQIFEVDAQNRRSRLLREVESRPGNNLNLNIQADLQLAVALALKEGIKNSSARGGAVVVQEVKTGKILALVSDPALDGNIFSAPLSSDDFNKLQSDPGKPFFDRAVLGVFPPGSVFKLVVATGALSEKVLDEKTLIEGPGSLTLGSLTFRDWKPQGHGQLNLVGAIGESCDTCFYQLGGGYQNFKGLGVEKMAAWARTLGLGQTLGIDLPAEAEGLVPDPAWKLKAQGERWFAGNTYNLAIGQGDLLTSPLQINSVTATIANGGTLFRPYLVGRITDSNGALVRSFSPQVLRSHVAETKYLDLVKQGMKKAVEPGGTAYPLFGFKIPLGGKTGTAETGRANLTHAWFTAFAPYDNPQIALTVFLEEGGEGSRDAAPVAKKILESYFGLKPLAPATPAATPLSE